MRRGLTQLSRMLRQETGLGHRGTRAATTQALAPTPLLGTSHARHASSLAFVCVIITLGSIALVQYLLEQVLVSHVKDIAVAELRVQQAAHELASTAALASALTKRAQQAAQRSGREFAVLSSDGRRLLGSLDLQPPTDCGPGPGCHRWLRHTTVDADGVQDWLGLDYRLPDGGHYITAHDIHPMITRTHPVPLLAGMGVYLALLMSLGGQLAVGIAKVRRVDQIRAAMWRFARGATESRVPVGRSDDEFDRLSQDINQALDRIAGLMDEVRHATNHVAHELRTPLLRLQQRLGDLALARQDDVLLADALAGADDEVQRIQYLFSAVMRISEIETGRCAQDWQAIDIAELLNDLLDYCGVQAQERGIHVRTDGQLGPQVQLMGDRALLLQSLVNLFDNAVKYAPSGSRMRVIAQSVPGHLLLGVADQGPGLPAELHERAMGRFQRFNTDRRVRGHGLGLALVKAVAELHGGSLQLSPDQPGDATRPGLRALLRLPAPATNMNDS